MGLRRWWCSHRRAAAAYQDEILSDWQYWGLRRVQREMSILGFSAKPCDLASDKRRSETSMPAVRRSSVDRSRHGLHWYRAARPGSR